MHPAIARAKALLAEQKKEKPPVSAMDDVFTRPQEFTWGTTLKNCASLVRSYVPDSSKESKEN